jgi:hypothetical protein
VVPVVEQTTAKGDVPDMREHVITGLIALVIAAKRTGVAAMTNCAKIAKEKAMYLLSPMYPKPARVPVRMT